MVFRNLLEAMMLVGGDDSIALVMIPITRKLLQLQ